MITVYGAPPTRSFRVVWALEELGLDYRLRAVDLRHRMNDAEFLKVNPAGFLPAIDDDGVVMVESVAILEYLIAKYNGSKLAPSSDEANFPMYQQFLHLGESGLAAYLNIVVATRFFASAAERDNFGAKVAERMFLGRLALVSKRLVDAPAMAGEKFSAADISVVYALDLADRLGLSGKFDEAVVAYRQRMSARAAYKAARDKPWS